jgi:hypothetical protein
MELIYFLSSIAVLTPDYSFSVMPVLHSVSDMTVANLNTITFGIGVCVAFSDQKLCVEH